MAPTDLIIGRVYNDGSKSPGRQQVKVTELDGSGVGFEWTGPLSGAVTGFVGMRDWMSFDGFIKRFPYADLNDGLDRAPAETTAEPLVDRSYRDNGVYGHQRIVIVTAVFSSRRRDMVQFFEVLEPSFSSFSSREVCLQSEFVSQYTLLPGRTSAPVDPAETAPDEDLGVTVSVDRVFNDEDDDTAPHDDAIVVQIDTDVASGQRIRVNLNDGVLFDGDMERDENGAQTLDAIAAIIDTEKSSGALRGEQSDLDRYELIVALVHAARQRSHR